MLTIDPKQIETPQLHQYLLGAVGPRPIALASTMDKNGNPNLSPFSFFNVFSANPPIMIFSPARRVRNNTTKHTLENCLTTKEVVINIVSYGMVEQTSLSSTEYPQYVNEFKKSGLTPLESEKVRPYRVKESPVQFECRVKEVVALGEDGGAGNLVICEVLLVHIQESVLDSDGKLDPFKLDLVGRMGGDWYVRANDEAMFEVAKPVRTLGIGVDQIPERIRNSFFLSHNDLGRLGNVEKLPSEEEVQQYRQETEIRQILEGSIDSDEQREQLYARARALLDNNKVWDAWLTLLIDPLNRA
jgi:flavin reductase (DIM6/NTAB) family NADH-FMN oxidoreductase RutF